MSKQQISILILATLSFAAHAHTGGGIMHGFSDGFMHPWIGVDHLLVMTAIGVWAVVLGGRSVWLLPTVFMTGMLAGAMLQFSGLMLNGVEIWVALSVFALGLVLLVNQHMSIHLSVALVVIFALAHGYVHAAEIGTDSNAASYALGFLTATAVLHATGIIAGLSGSVILKTLQTSVGLICTLAGVVLLAGA
ncbi:MAG: HupE/UreJ family protein [Methylococcales bacterium]